MKRYWLMKSEPTCFSIDDLKKQSNQTTHWDGIRNYQARNFIRDDIKPHDEVFFYHSNCETPGIVGVAEVVSEAYPDFTAFDPTSEHPDPKSNPENPTWFMVDIRFKEKFKHPILLQQMKHYPELKEMILLRKGNRLSVLPVQMNEWKFINELAS